MPVTRVRLGGGGARSPVWRQIQADVYGHDVEIVEAEEGAAYGAALLAGVGWRRRGRAVDAACEAVVRVANRVRGRAGARATLRERYEVFRRVYPALRALVETPEPVGASKASAVSPTEAKGYHSSFTGATVS